MQRQRGRNGVKVYSAKVLELHEGGGIGGQLGAGAQKKEKEEGHETRKENNAAKKKQFFHPTVLTVLPSFSLCSESHQTFPNIVQEFYPVGLWDSLYLGRAAAMRVMMIGEGGCHACNDQHHGLPCPGV